MNEFSFGEIVLSRQEMFLIGALVVLALMIGQYSIHLLRQRQKLVTAIFIFAMTIAISYAMSYYRSIHAPEKIVEQLTYASKKAGNSIVETNKEINNGMFHFARGYSNKSYSVDDSNNSNEKENGI